MKAKHSFFIVTTGIMIILAVITTGLRFGIQKNFFVNYQERCAPEDDSCEDVLCDDIYSKIFECTEGDSISVKNKKLSYHDFFSRINK